MISFSAPAKRASECARDKKAENIRLLDIRRFSSVADYCLLVSVDSPALMRALQDHISETLEHEFALRPLHQEGRGSAQWLVLDYGGLVVHMMHPQAREFYGLERLWENAREIAESKASASKKPRKRALARRK